MSMWRWACRPMCMMHDEKSQIIAEWRYEFHGADADGGVRCGFDISEAISSCTAVSWHSSYPWATTQSTRRFGGSTVIMYDGDGHSFVGLLRAALHVAAPWGVGQRYLGMICRVGHDMTRVSISAILNIV